MKENWTAEEDAFLLRWYGEKGDKWVCDQLDRKKGTGTKRFNVLNANGARYACANIQIWRLEFLRLTKRVKQEDYDLERAFWLRERVSSTGKEAS